VLAVVGWLLFGPRGVTSWRVTALIVLYPLAWLAVTLIGGPIVGWYPYPFVDVNQLGYPRVVVNVVLVAVMFLGVADAATGLDRWLTKRRVVASASELV